MPERTEHEVLKVHMRASMAANTPSLKLHKKEILKSLRKDQETAPPPQTP